MQKATAALLVVVALAGSALAQCETGTFREGVPILMPPVPCVDVEIAGDVVGVAHDGTDFWVSKLAEPTDVPAVYHKLDEWGAITATFEQGGVQGDLGHGDGTAYLYSLFGSECWYLKRFSSTGTYTEGEYFEAPNPPFSPWNPVQTVCYASALNRWYVGGYAPNVYSCTWTGTWGEVPTWTPIMSTYLPGVRGIAYDPTRDCLWIADSSDNALYQVDSSGGPVLGQIPLWGALYGSPRGLCITDTAAHGLVLAATFVNERAPSRFVLFDLGTITPVETQSWGSIKALYR